MAKEKYIVMDGVAHVNGAKVPDDRIVTLTPAEALYDLGLGRIAPVPKPRATQAKKKDYSETLND